MKIINHDLTQVHPYHCNKDYEGKSAADRPHLGQAIAMPPKRHKASHDSQDLYDEDRLIPREYLYVPGINLELGSAYLQLLHNRYFIGIKDPVKRQYISICAYNWGPTAVRKKVLDTVQVSKMSRDELYNVLMRKTPQETREYLVKVTKRIQIYSGYFPG